MFRLRKYFKKYWLLFFLAIGCILGQAAGELALPDYMSNIVSNGIQAGGFDNAVSPVLTKENYDHIMLFVSGKDKKTIEKSYTFTKYESLSDETKKTFPKLRDAYILKDNADEDKLNSALLKPMLISSSIDTMDHNSKQYKDLTKKLTDGLEKGEKKYQEGLKKYNDGVSKLEKSKKQIEDGLAKIKTSEKKIDDGLSGIAKAKEAKAKLDNQFGSLDKLNSMITQMNQALAVTPEGEQKEALKAQLAGLTQAKSGYEQLVKAVAAESQLKEAKAKIAPAKEKLEKAQKEITKAEAKLPDAKKKIDEAKEKLDEARKNADSGNLYYFLESMDSKQKNEMFKNIDKQMDTMGESTMNIAGGSAVKNIYKDLGANTDDVQNSYIFAAGIKMLVIALLGAVASIAAAFFASKVGASVARDLRLDLFKKVESFSTDEMNKFSTASLITRSTNDITQVQQVVVMFIRLVCFAPVLGIGALIKALQQSVSMTMVIGLVLVIILVVLGVTFGIAMPKFKIIQSLIDKLNLSMRENLTGVLVIRAFGNEEEAERRFDLSNTDLTKVNLFVNRVMISLMPLMMFLMNAVTLAIVYVGAKQIDLGNIQIGQMMAFLQYGMMIIIGFLMVAVIAIMLPRASISAGRIADVLETTNTITNLEETKSFDEDLRGVVEFDHVTFAYPGSDEPVLSDITFAAKPGTTTAFIGSTGSGKSTLINLVPRFFDVTDGSIKVDGQDIRNVDMHELRERIGLVPQKANLFTGTIRSNLMYGAPNATEEDLERALKISQSEEFVSHLENGIDSEIASGGTNVSGGQRQRLAIARALAKNPEIMIFDDSFSALDFKTDAKLRKELNQMCAKEHNTVLLVGQRIASIMHAENIIVLDEGKVVGQGRHDDLLKNCQVYQEIAYSQLSKEELENERS